MKLLHKEQIMTIRMLYFTSLLVSSALLALCPEYALYTKQKDNLNQQVADLQVKIRTLDELLSNGQLDPFNRREVFRDREYRKEELETALASLVHIDSQLKLCAQR